jgi:3-keto-disaccharide hydrolase
VGRMNPGRLVIVSVALMAAAAWTLMAAAQQPPLPSIVGRWDLVVSSPDGAYPSWLELQRSGNRALVGRFVGRTGSARPIASVEASGQTFRFSIPPQWERGDRDLHVEGTLDGDRLTGWMADPSGARLAWTGTRAPALRRAMPVWGPPVALFDGADMSRWRTAEGSQWLIVDRALTNEKAGANLLSRDTYTDFRLRLEFRYAKSGNSGVYLRGRYEVQIEDSPESEAASERLGSIYGFLSPNEDAAKRPGEWQTFDIMLVGRLVTVILNGKIVIGAQEIPGITGGALDSDEGAPGPLMLQGDHGPIQFRNIVITPAQ